MAKLLDWKVAGRIGFESISAPNTEGALG